MSITVMSMVYKARLGCPLRKAVMLKLGDCSDDDGRNIWPAVSTIAAQAEIAERTVQNKLADLLACGLIRVSEDGGGRGRTTCYEIDLDLLHDLARGRLVVSMDDGRMQLVPPAPENPAPRAPFHGEQPDEKGAPDAPFLDENPAPDDRNPAAGAENPAPRAPYSSRTILDPPSCAPEARAGGGAVKQDRVKGDDDVETMLADVASADPRHERPVDWVLAPLCRLLRLDAPSPAYALRVLADWLARQDGLTPETAAEIVEQARQGRTRTIRQADIEEATKAVLSRARAAAKLAVSAASRRPCVTVRATDAAWPAWLGHLTETGRATAADQALTAGHLQATAKWPGAGVELIWPEAA